MRAIIVPVGAMPEVVEIDGSLKFMQEAVGGCIEPCSWVFGDVRVMQEINAEYDRMFLLLKPSHFFR